MLNNQKIEVKIEFLEKGDRKIWEIANSHDSVSILIYDKERDGFIFVRQFRVSVFMRGGSGYMYELCAGLCDKQKLPIEIAKDEIAGLSNSVLFLKSTHIAKDPELAEVIKGRESYRYGISTIIIFR